VNYRVIRELKEVIEGLSRIPSNLEVNLRFGAELDETLGYAFIRKAILEYVSEFFGDLTIESIEGDILESVNERDATRRVLEDLYINLDLSFDFGDPRRLRRSNDESLWNEIERSIDRWNGM